MTIMHGNRKYGTHWVEMMNDYTLINLNKQSSIIINLMSDRQILKTTNLI